MQIDLNKNVNISADVNMSSAPKQPIWSERNGSLFLKNYPVDGPMLETGLFLENDCHFDV
jgi:hypothetical protein